MVRRKKHPPQQQLAPHANAAAHAKVMAWLKTATPAEVMARSIEVGVYTPDGKLTEPYR